MSIFVIIYRTRGQPAQRRLQQGFSEFQVRMTASTAMDKERQVVADDFIRLLRPETALPVAAINTLIGVIRRSTNTTFRGMEAELQEAIKLMEDTLQKENPDNRYSAVRIDRTCLPFFQSSHWNPYSIHARYCSRLITRTSNSLSIAPPGGRCASFFCSHFKQ